MAVQAKLFRTTVFKLALAFFAFSAVGAALVLANVAYSAKTLMDRQMAETIDAEIKGLSDQYAQGGIDALARTIDRRTGEPGAALYLLTDFAGERLSGNVAALPPDVLSSPRVVEIAYRRVGDPARLHHALARIFALDGGFRLLVGRDLEEREALRNVVARALFTSLFYLAAIGAVGGFFVSSRVLRRVDAMNDRARAIMHGDLDARLPVSGSGDEFDRLAANLNAMIERIGELMAGLKEVSDDIAHDLRTPLTRLRNRAEAAMRGAEGDPAAREALAKVIEESEGLIRVFDALLLIARAEVGAAGVGMAPFDAAEVVRSVAELYEPAAEEAGFRMAVDASALAPVTANRELVGQVLSNLVENALKYGASAGGEKLVTLAVRRSGGSVEIDVADRGPGVAEQDRERVLRRFVRLEESRTKSGSGLGLSLAAAVARLHGGALSLSDAAPGLRVTLRLPEAPALPPPAKSALPPPAAPRAGARAHA